MNAVIETRAVKGLPLGALVVNSPSPLAMCSSLPCCGVRPPLAPQPASGCYIVLTLQQKLLTVAYVGFLLALQVESLHRTT